MALCCLRPLFCYSFGCAEKTDGVIFEVNIMDAIGNTPLFELKNIFVGRNNVSVFAKAEFLNPSGSVKDRACIRYDWSAAWISRTALSALQREHRAEEDHPGIWRRNYRDRPFRGGGRRFFSGERACREESGSILLPGSVQQRCELEGTLYAHGGGNLEADPRENYPFCGGGGDVRNLCRKHEEIAGT